MENSNDEAEVSSLRHPLERTEPSTATPRTSNNSTATNGVSSLSISSIGKGKSSVETIATDGDSLPGPVKQQQQNENDDDQNNTMTSRSLEDDDSSHNSSSVILSSRDLALVSKLDSDYERALESVHVGYAARYQSVRQSALCSVIFMTLLLILGTIFFLKQAPNWTTSEAILFSVYTVTTVGYGQLAHPETAAFQLYVVGYILIGIATLTIMVAQVYQCIALEASRAQISADGRQRRERRQLRRRLSTGIFRPSPVNNSTDASVSSFSVSAQEWLQNFLQGLLQRCWAGLQSLYHYLREDEIGRGISVTIPLTGLVLIGALVIGVLEGWNMAESLYFSVVR